MAPEADLAVDGHDGNVQAVLRLQIRVAIDVHDIQKKAVAALPVAEALPRLVAEMAPLTGVQRKMKAGAPGGRPKRPKFPETVKHDVGGRAVPPPCPEWRSQDSGHSLF